MITNNDYDDDDGREAIRYPLTELRPDSGLTLLMICTPRPPTCHRTGTSSLTASPRDVIHRCGCSADAVQDLSSTGTPVGPAQLALGNTPRTRRTAHRHPSKQRHLLALAVKRNS